MRLLQTKLKSFDGQPFAAVILDAPYNALPPAQSVKPRRVPSPGEPLAFCADCHEWTPVKWLPIKERGKRAEQWFQANTATNAI